MAIALTDLQGWWDFSDGSGSTVTDQTGSNNGTSANSPTWVSDGPSNIPNGLDFVAASSQFVDFNVNFNDSSGSASVWFRPDDVTTSSIVFGDGNGGGGGDFDIAIISSEVRTITRFNSSGDEIITSSISNDTLYHVVYTWSDPNLSLYVNNGSALTNNTGTGGITGGTDQLHAATRTSETALFFDGTIYQCILFNKVLNSSEVSTLYNSGSGISYSGLFGGDFYASPTFFSTGGVGLA